jgi:hypothetical protein
VKRNEMICNRLCGEPPASGAEGGSRKHAMK